MKVDAKIKTTIITPEKWYCDNCKCDMTSDNIIKYCGKEVCSNCYNKIIDKKNQDSYIRYGIKNSFSKHGKCSTCGAYLSETSVDVIEDRYVYETNYYITCLSCNTKVFYRCK